MGYELSHKWIHEQLPTSDCQVGRGLHFTHTVLRHTGEGSLITDGCFFNPQEEVLFFISDVIPDKIEEVEWH